MDDKEMFMLAHEELIEKYLIAHPNADWHQAYEATADLVWDYYRDKWADYCDHVHDMAKDELLK